MPFGHGRSSTALLIEGVIVFKIHIQTDPVHVLAMVPSKLDCASSKGGFETASRG